ncbi:SagB/ThcOx family dehydrogenase, partial [Patescibacteria group bacterium]|nr:SagB/ThcOx family dehydrogenase [Patescibacteria group bacterium]
IVLPEAAPESKDLFLSVHQRASTSSFKGSSPIGLQALAVFLKYSCGIQRESRSKNVDAVEVVEQHRAQPSAGARFPLEMYFFNFVSGEIPSGIYHYDVKEHRLDVLEERVFTPEDIKELFTYEYVSTATGVFVLTALFWRNKIKYGERGYRYVLLEAGHIGQNISLIASALSYKATMMGGSIDLKVESALDIDGITESVVYAAAVGF